MIQFVANHDDHSTDRGFQFTFHCDRCGNGFMSQFQPSVAGIAESVLRTAGNIVGGWLGSTAWSSYELERTANGTLHDSAFRKAVEEGKQHFHQCQRCGKWVCPEVCWNAKVHLCGVCAPDVTEEVAAARVQAEVEAARQKAIEEVQHPALAAGGAHHCSQCGHEVGHGKFCPECGTAVAAAKPKCVQCGFEPVAATKFCPECGAKMQG